MADKTQHEQEQEDEDKGELQAWLGSRYTQKLLELLKVNRERCAMESIAGANANNAHHAMRFASKVELLDSIVERIETGEM